MKCFVFQRSGDTSVNLLVVSIETLYKLNMEHQEDDTMTMITLPDGRFHGYEKSNEPPMELASGVEQENVSLPVTPEKMMVRTRRTPQPKYQVPRPVQAPYMIAADDRSWLREHQDLTQWRQQQMIQGHDRALGSYAGSMSIKYQTPQRATIPARLQGQGPTLYQVYKDATQHTVNQNLHLHYPHQPSAHAVTQQALQHAQYAQQLREYEFQLELQRREKGEQAVKIEAQQLY